MVLTLILKAGAAETSGTGLGGNARETDLVSCLWPRIVHDICLTICVVRGGGTMHLGLSECFPL